MQAHAKLARTARKLLEEVQDLAPEHQAVQLDREALLAVARLLREVAAKEAMLDCLEQGNLARRSEAAAGMIDEMLNR